jgi:phage-related protein/predicted XRE-type DNA-binding protein
VQDSFGFELFLAQTGQHPPSAKLLKGLGSGTVELIDDFDGDTYRAVYTVRLASAVYVLHAFKKKSKQGSKTPHSDIDLIKRRLKDAEADPGEQKMTAKIEVHEGSGNIFADLGLPAADSHFLKAQIVAELYRLTNARKLTQDKAGEVMGISQPEVSRLFKGNFREYSIERLMAFLTAFDLDVEIVSRPRPKRSKKSDRGQIIFKPVAA